MSNDRIQQGEGNAKLPKPEVKIIVNGREVVKPGMRTFFADTNEGDGMVYSGDKTSSNVVAYTVCTCNTVPVCSCNSYVKPSCSCNSQSHSYSVCSCVPVH